MKTLTCSLILAVLLTIPVMQAQQSPSPAPPTPAQKLAPCVAASPLPKRVKIKVPAWLQKQIDKQQAKLGTTIDVNGMIADATAPKPCPPAPSPASVVTVPSQANPKQ
jgi:hypothetical protein